jgi:hypothetical protein
MRSCKRFCDCWGGSTKNTIHDGGHAECGIRIERSNELQRLKMYRHIIP